MHSLTECPNDPMRTASKQGFNAEISQRIMYTYDFVNIHSALLER